MPTTEELKQLFAEFPREAISWRAQSVTKTGDKALALAYIDARDVMDRLDDVCGSENWQDRYEFHGTRTICYLSIRVDGEWITKADGAGDSDVEAEKGAISDALKRAAVKWGVGRYLYHIVSPWVPCESYETEYQGKKKWNWRSWKEDPWSFVKGAKQPATPPKRSKAASRDLYTDLERDMRRLTTTSDLADWWKDNDCREKRASMPEDWQRELHEEFKALGFTLKAKEDKEREAFPGSISDREALQHPLNA